MLLSVQWNTIHNLLQSSEGDTVTPAQFDWNKSGLTDPLSENGNN